MLVYAERIRAMTMKSIPDASDEQLIKRYKEQSMHPGKGRPVIQGINLERERLSRVRESHICYKYQLYAAKGVKTSIKLFGDNQFE